MISSSIIYRVYGTVFLPAQAGRTGSLFYQSMWRTTCNRCKQQQHLLSEYFSRSSFNLSRTDLCGETVGMCRKIALLLAKPGILHHTSLVIG